MSLEQMNDQEQDLETTEQTSQQSDTTGSNESTDTNSEDDSTKGFDHESLEMSFGLPPGSLKDVSDDSSALKAIQAIADKKLLAGLTRSFESQQEEEEIEEPVVQKPAQKKVQTTPDGEQSMMERIAKLEARDKEREKELNNYKKQVTSQGLKELERRFVTEVDSWASPKYGVTGSRNYEQTQNYLKLRDELLPNYANGAAFLGEKVSEIEKAARGARAYHDPEGTLEWLQKRQRKAGANTAGTPGQRREPADSKKPRSIHDRVFNMK